MKLIGNLKQTKVLKKEPDYKRDRGKESIGVSTGNKRNTEFVIFRGLVKELKWRKKNRYHSI